MERADFVLAALSTVPNAEWTPVQVQKLFFLIDKKLGPQVGGPFFSFVAYDYGPFDADIYREIDRLETGGYATVNRPNFGMRTFSLSGVGQSKGAHLLGELSGESRDYMRKLGAWIRSLNFSQLVSAVYREFPEMRANSIFRD